MTPRARKRRGLLVLCLFGALLFAALGAWQVQRLFWKLDLIARVEARIHAVPVAIPARQEWPTLDLRDVEYRHVRVRGEWLHDRETLVDALTERGPGAWVMTPLATPDGTVLINRGFVTTAGRDANPMSAGPLSGEATITGLLRLTEPGGRLLRPNEPETDRWFSRDVAAIAAARGLTGLAPFFIDADGSSNPGGVPVGGLTVVKFRNAHLVYATTWFGLAALCVSGLLLVKKTSSSTWRLRDRSRVGCKPLP